MKLYVHYEREPEFTAVFQYSGEESEHTLGDLLQEFCSQYNRKFSAGFQLKASELDLYGTKRKLKLSLQVKSAVIDKQDVFVVPRVSDGPTSPPVRATVSASPANKPKADPNSGGQQLMLAGSLVENKQCVRAKQIYQDLITAGIKVNKSLTGICEIYIKAERFDKATPLLKQAIEKFPEDSVDLKTKLGDCYLAQGKGEEALDTFINCRTQLESAKGKSGGNQKAIDDLSVKCGKALLILEKEVEALHTFQVLLKKGVKTTEALLEYSLLGVKHEILELKDAINIVLSCLVKSKGNESRCMPHLLTLLSYPDGMNCLQGAMTSAWVSAAALTYLANNLRDHGGVQLAATLMQRAVAMDTADPRPLLNLMHIYETTNSPQLALDFALNYLESNGGLTIGGRPVAPSSLVDLLEAGIRSKPFKGPLMEAGGPAKEAYTETDIYNLAVLFTTVKILFVRGSHHHLPDICTIIDPLHDGHDLHRTLVCNEAAYYSCISHLVKVQTPRLRPLPAQPPPSKLIYFAGDSHCIAPAWRTIEYQGEEHVIHPLLSTGTKIWHLRPSATFYPKTTFYNQFNNLPQHSTVIFCLGEIDCREGIPSSLAKCSYETKEEAILFLVDLYLGILLGLKSRYQLREVYVHPVNPVLDPTRELVLQFNAILAEKVLETRGQLKWMNFIHLLLSDSQTNLKSEFKLDGTHLHPSYCTLLQESLL